MRDPLLDSKAPENPRPSVGDAPSDFEPPLRLFLSSGVPKGIDDLDPLSILRTAPFEPVQQRVAFGTKVVRCSRSQENAHGIDMVCQRRRSERRPPLRSAAIDLGTAL